MSDGSLFVLERVIRQKSLGEVLMSKEIAQQLCEKIKEFASRAALEAGDGIELVDVAFYTQYGKLTVEAFLWKKEGIDLDDCEKVHNLLSAKLDTIENDFDDDYILNVSSQGLDRKIVTNDDFRRALDTEIEVFDLNKKKSHGTLLSFDDDNIVIKTDGKNPKEIKIQRNLLTKVQPYVRF